MRVTRNALTAARRAASRRLSWPISRNEHQPMTSHPTRVRTRSPDWTTSSIAARKSETVAANTATRGSSRRYHRVNDWTASPTTRDGDRDDRRQRVGDQVQRHRQPAERQRRHGRHRLGRAQPLDRRQLAGRGEQREERPERGDRGGQPPAACGRERQHGGDGGHQDDEPGAQLHEVVHAPGSVRSMLPAAAVEREDDGQRDADLGGGDGDDEQGEHVPGAQRVGGDRRRP